MRTALRWQKGDLLWEETQDGVGDGRKSMRESCDAER